MTEPEEIGFFLQLKVLMWKNFILKLRSPIVLLVELLAPLVLMSVLVFVRQSQPPEPVADTFYPAQPLPSAGVAAFLHTLCTGEEMDKDGFINEKTSRLNEVLDILQRVADETNFFRPALNINDLDTMPEIYQQIISEPAQAYKTLKTAKDPEVAFLFMDASKVKSYLEKNSPLTRTEIDALLSSQINITGALHLLAASNASAQLLEALQTDQVSNSMQKNHFPKGLTMKNRTDNIINAFFLKDAKALQNISKDFIHSTGELFDKKALATKLLQNSYLMLDPQIQDVTAILLGFKDPSDLSIAEIVNVLKKVFVVYKLKDLLCTNDMQQVLIPQKVEDKAHIDSSISRLCGMSSLRWDILSSYLADHISADKIMQKLEPIFNFSTKLNDAKSLMTSVKRFRDFEETMVVIGKIEEALSFGQAPCMMGGMNATDGDQKDILSMDMMDLVAPTWEKIHGVICAGQDNQEGFTGSTATLQSLKLMMDFLNGKVKILYSPTGTAADEVIKEINSTFALVENVSQYAARWKLISPQIREYLTKETTSEDFKAMSEMHAEIQKFPTKMDIIKNPDVREFLQNGSMPNATFFLKQLDQTDEVACKWLSLQQHLKFDVFKGFTSERDLVDYFHNKAYSEGVQVFASIVFDNLSYSGPLPPHVVYRIRMNGTQTQTTLRTEEIFKNPPIEGFDRRYYEHKFVWLQDVVERAIINIHAGRPVTEPGIYAHEMPHPCHTRDSFLFMTEHVMPNSMHLSVVYFVAMLVHSIVYEKEYRLKEVMKMMGLSKSVHWAAWFLISFAELLCVMICLSLMLSVGGVLGQSKFAIVLLSFTLTAILTISFCCLVSTFFSKAKVAAASAGILYLVGHVPYIYVTIQEEVVLRYMSSAFKWFACLFPSSTFGFVARYFAFYELQEGGVQWDNINVAPVVGDSFTLLTILIAMVQNIFLFALLTWYIENVFPGTYGLPKPWYFPFTASYWCGNKGISKSKISMGKRYLPGRYAFGSVIEEEDNTGLHGTQNSRMFEAEPTHRPLGVSIRNLTKVYDNGKVAVNNFNLNLYEGQITSFLGHNGAGKTSIMSLLTGLFTPTSGHATIYGFDIRTDMSQIRRDLGMCPQHNVLFEKLTVEEHLWFYARLKGVKTEDIMPEIDKMIEDIALPHKRHSKIDCLSGGMQRKLSVAIAFVGGSRTVILDEPTAGVDPYARREIWDLLIKYKKGRTILLSTHHMDEADILGDRIAIISNGQLICAGSTLFLKSAFGDGYHLTLVKKQRDINPPDIDDVAHSYRPGCHSGQVTSFIQHHVTAAYLHSENMHELHYILPFGSAKNGSFPSLFAALDASLEMLEISSYGMMDTSLEKVFLRVTEGAAVEKAYEEVSCAGSKHWHNSVKKDTPDQKRISLCDVVTKQIKGNIGTLARASLNNGHKGCSSSRGHNLGNTHSRSSSCGSLRDLCPENGPNLEEGSQNTQSTESISNSLKRRNTNGQMGQQQETKARSTLKEQTHGLWDSMYDPAMASDMEDSVLLANNQGSNMASIEDITTSGDGTFSNAAFRPRRSTMAKNKRRHMFRQQFKAIIVKRYLYTTRNWRGLISQIVLPSLFIAVTLIVSLGGKKVVSLKGYTRKELQHILQQPGSMFHKWRTSYEIVSQDLPSLELSAVQYDKFQTAKFLPFSAAPNDTISQSIVNTFFELAGSGSSCLLRSPQSSATVANLDKLKGTAAYNRFRPDFLDTTCGKTFKKNLDQLTAGRAHSSIRGNGSSKQYIPSCTCDSIWFRGQVCKYTDVPNPPSFQMTSGDILQDITGQDEQNYYLNTLYKTQLDRNGGFTLGHDVRYVPQNYGKNAPSIFHLLAVRKTAKVNYNHRGMHSLPTYINVLNNAILRANVPPGKGNPSAYGITAINHPMNKTSIVHFMDAIQQGSDILIADFIICAMAFVPASFVVFLVYEKSIKAKHLQCVSGMNRYIYWLANFAWDMCNYIVPCVCCLLILRAYNIEAYVSPENFPAVIMLFLLYGWSMTPMMYPASFLFNEPSTAYVALIIINLFIGNTCVICTYILELFVQQSHGIEIGELVAGISTKDEGATLENMKFILDLMKHGFLVFPNYCLGRGIMDVAFNSYINKYLRAMGNHAEVKSPFAWDVASRNLASMVVMGLLSFLFTLFCEFMSSRRARLNSYSNEIYATMDEDIDVAAERKRVMQGMGRYDMLRLTNLTKVYKTKLGDQRAVDHLTLGVPQGECFGLLGVNGAGKTTTFKMLTGDVTPSGGDATLNRYSIRNNLSKVQQGIGYCPQFDALYDTLTGREHLMLYARLRGVPTTEQNKVVEWTLAQLSLTQYADKLCGTYSGGNKRKLSTAIALIGDPPVIFLDEPTTGMDPQARRFLWNFILQLVQEGRSIVLTSHSMEECEALCTRLAIMVNGTFKCLGSVQHLKTRFGDGYTVIVRLRGIHLEEEVHAVTSFMQQRLRDVVLKGCHYDMVQFELPSLHLSLSQVFSSLEEASRDLPITDYSVSQNTLDNVFINFVENQRELQQEINGSSSLKSVHCME